MWSHAKGILVLLHSVTQQRPLQILASSSRAIAVATTLDGVPELNYCLATDTLCFFDQTLASVAGSTSTQPRRSYEATIPT
jgi:hypothetical protein